MLEQAGNVKVAHVFREANICADLMASISIKQSKEEIICIGPLQAIDRLLIDDKEGTSYTCRI